MEQTSTYLAVLELVNNQQVDACLMLRLDFAPCGPMQEVDAAISQLIEQGKLAQLRDDAFAFVDPSPISGKMILRCSLQALAREYAIRQGANLRNTVAQTRYANGQTKQVPNSRYVGVDKPIEGSLRFRQRSVCYECI